jgi:hypothetical protein
MCIIKQSALGTFAGQKVPDTTPNASQDDGWDEESIHQFSTVACIMVADSPPANDTHSIAGHPSRCLRRRHRRQCWRTNVARGRVQGDRDELTRHADSSRGPIAGHTYAVTTTQTHFLRRITAQWKARDAVKGHATWMFHGALQLNEPVRSSY